MKILVTGAAGFIGNNFCAKLLDLKKNYQIIGIDNINNYYSPKIKKKRISRLKKYKNFSFFKINLKDKKKIQNLFKKHKFSEVYNFAAQAGVRYSVINPQAYLESNVIGFSNLIEISKNYKVKKFFFASSSSVYGDLNKFPIKENNHLYPKNLYGLSKKYNEEVAKLYYENYKFKSVGLRFFTIFGEWGRPDMFIIKYLIASYNKRKFYLNNHGNHLRDFTYINDVLKNLLALRTKKINGFEVFNICSNNPVNLHKIIKLLEKKIPKTNIQKRGMQLADIYKTHGDNKKLIKKVGFKSVTKFEDALNKTVNWFKVNKKMFN